MRLTLVAYICRMGKKRRSKADSRPNVRQEKKQHRPQCKKRKSKRKNYGVAQAEQALQDVADGMSVKKAAHKWGIPRTTLNDIKLGRYSVSARPARVQFSVKPKRSSLKSGSSKCRVVEYHSYGKMFSTAFNVY